MPRVGSPAVPSPGGGGGGGQRRRERSPQESTRRAQDREQQALQQALSAARQDGDGPAIRALENRLAESQQVKDQDSIPFLGDIPGVQRAIDVLNIPVAAVAGGVDELLTGGFDGNRSFADYVDRLLPGGRRSQAQYGDILANVAGTSPTGSALGGLPLDIVLDPLNLLGGAGLASTPADLAKAANVANAVSDTANVADTAGDVARAGVDLVGNEDRLTDLLTQSDELLRVEAKNAGDVTRTLDGIEVAQRDLALAEDALDGVSDAASIRSAKRAVRGAERRLQAAERAHAKAVSSPRNFVRRLPADEGVDAIQAAADARLIERSVDDANEILNSSLTDFSVGRGAPQLDLKGNGLAEILDSRPLDLGRMQRVTRQEAVARLQDAARTAGADAAEGYRKLALQVERDGLSAMGRGAEARSLANAAGLHSGLTFAGRAIPYADVVWSTAAAPFGKILGAARGSNVARGTGDLARKLGGRNAALKAAAQSNDPVKFAQAVALSDYRAVVNTRRAVLAREMTDSLARHLTGSEDATAGNIRSILRSLDSDNPEFFAALSRGDDTFKVGDTTLDLNAFRNHQIEIKNGLLRHNLTADKIRTGAWYPQNVNEWRNLLESAKDGASKTFIQRLMEGGRLKKGDTLFGRTLATGSKAEVQEVVDGFIRSNFPTGADRLLNNPGQMLQSWHQVAAKEIASRQAAYGVLMEAAEPGSAFRLGEDIGLNLSPLDRWSPADLTDPKIAGKASASLSRRVKSLRETAAQVTDDVLANRMTVEADYLDAARQLIRPSRQNAAAVEAVDDLSRAQWAKSLAQEGQILGLGREIGFPAFDAAKIRDINSSLMNSTVNQFRQTAARMNPQVLMSKEIADVIVPQYVELGRFTEWFLSKHNLFRAMALTIPGFHIRNAYGGAFNNWTAGMRASDYFDYLRTIKKLQRGEGSEEVRRFFRDLGFDEVATAGRPQELTDILEAGAGKRRAPVTNALNRAQARMDEGTGLAIGMGARGTVEQHLRASLAWTIRKRGGSLTEARTAINKFHFDYWDLTNAEAGIRAYVPFYTWTARNVPMTMEMMLRRPAKYVHYLNAQDDIVTSYENEGETFPYWARNIFGFLTPFTIGDERVSTSVDLPFVSTLQLAKDLFGKEGIVSFVQPDGSIGLDTSGYRKDRAFDVALSFTSPFIKAAVETKTGQSIFTGRDIEEWEPFPTRTWVSKVPGAEHLFRLLDYAGLARVNSSGELESKGYIINTLEQFLPMFSRAGRIIPDDEGAPVNWLGLFSMITGMTTRTLSTDATDTHAYASLEETQNLIDSTIGKRTYR